MVTQASTAVSGGSFPTLRRKKDHLVELFCAASHAFCPEIGDCSIATGADSKIARQEQGESTWDPLNASESAPNSANGLIPSLIAWAKSQLPGNVAIVSKNGDKRNDQ